jgi:hypothetical protein
MLSFTTAAASALIVFQQAAARFDPDVRIRLTREGAILRPELTHEPIPGDEVIEIDGLVVFHPAELEGVVDAGEHNELTLRAG